METENTKRGAASQIELATDRKRHKKRGPLLSPSELASLRALPFLTTEQMVQAYPGIFTEATLKYWRKQTRKNNTQYGPPFSKPTEGLVVYNRENVDKWLESRLNPGKNFRTAG